MGIREWEVLDMTKDGQMRDGNNIAVMPSCN